MSLIDALAADVPVVHHGRPCEFKRWRLTLTSEEQAAVSAALDNPLRTNDWIARQLSANGFDVSETTIAKHRRNGCKSCRS